MSGSSDTGSSLRRKLFWLIGARVVIVTILLGSGVLVQLRTPGLWPVEPFFFLVGLSYALAVAFLLTRTLVERRRWLIDLQLATDTVVISAVVLLTGGVSSYFSPLYALPIIGASILQFRRGGLLVGALSALLYAGVGGGQYQGAFEFLETRWSAIGQLARPPATLAFYMTGLDIFGFLAVAVLSGYLAERLRSAHVSLARASSEIAVLQAFNQHVIEGLTSGLATTDRHGRVLTFNGAAEQITGHRVADVLGRRIFELLQLPPVFEASLDTTVEGSRRADLRFTTPDGRELEIGLSAARLVIPGGQSGFLFMFQDVTETRRLQRKSVAQVRLAAVGEMAAGIAHEIRNPLASMSGSIQVLRQELPLSAEQAQLMDIVLRETDRLNALIGGFLRYARPGPMKPEAVVVRRAVEELTEMLASALPQGVRLESDVPESVAVWADPGQLRQVLWNLCLNAWQAMPEGGEIRIEAAEVTGGAAPQGGAAGRRNERGVESWVEICVRDAGTGMSPEVLDTIFDPFVTPKAEGSGLGLAIVHRIIEEHGGSIRVESGESCGTTVRIGFPRAEDRT